MVRLHPGYRTIDVPWYGYGTAMVWLRHDDPIKRVGTSGSDGTDAPIGDTGGEKPVAPARPA